MPLPADKRAKVTEVLDNIYFGVAGTGPVPGAIETEASQELVVALLTKIVVGACSTWWSFKELMEYISTKREVRNLINDHHSRQSAP